MAKPSSTHVSLDRALLMLDALSQRRDGLTVSDLARAVGCHKSTSLRLLQTLERWSYVSRNAATARYQLGLQVLTLAHAKQAELTVQQVAEPAVRRLAELTGETISVGMLDGPEIVYIHRLKAAPSAQLNTPVGARAPAHCTSLGKILLADHTPDEVRRLVGEGPFPAFTPRTITRLEDLQADLERARQWQYAVNDEEHRPGQVCIATPIRDYTGMVIAGISVLLPAIQATSETRESVVSYLQNASEEISTALGFQPRRRKRQHTTYTASDHDKLLNDA